MRVELFFHPEARVDLLDALHSEVPTFTFTVTPR